MKIVVMGTGPFCVPSLQWLLESQHEICGVVTRPIPDAGKRRKSAANPVRDLVETSTSLTLIDPVNANDDATIAQLETWGADLLFVCDFGQILKKRTLATTRLGGINLHGSLLPKYRGAAPINWAIYQGERESGVTVIHMTPKLDGGPALTQRVVAIGNDETAEQLEPRLAESGVDAVREAIGMLESWDGQSPIGQMQKSELVTRAPRLQKRQGNIDWNQSAQQIFNQVRAFQPWPGSFTHWIPVTGKPLRLIVLQASLETQSTTEDAGTVVSVEGQRIQVATGNGRLNLLRIQPAGKKAMAVEEFLRGRKVSIGDRFGDP